MAKKINQPNQTPEGGESKNQKLKKQKTTTNAAIQNILTEQEKREVQYFLSSMEGTKRGQSRTGEKNEAEEIQKKFAGAGPHIRGSKEIIKKLRSMQYTGYDSRGKYVGICTYNYNEYFLQYATPEILKDKKFMLELIKGNPKLINCLSTDLLDDKRFVLSVLDMIKKDKEKSDITNFYKNMSESLKEDEEVMEKIVAIGSWETAHAAKAHLIAKDSKILDNKKLMKKIVKWDGGYDRHTWPEKIREDKEYILAVYQREGLKSFYTYGDKDKHFYEGFFQRVKNILVQEGQIQEDEKFLAQMYAKRPELETNKPNLDADILKKFAESNSHCDNIDLKELNSYADIRTLMDQYIKRLDISQMSRLINYLQTYAKSGLQEVAEQCIQKFVEQNNLQSIDEKFLALSEKERLLVTRYRHNQNRGEKHTDEMNFGCGGHGGFKTPTQHESCLTGRANLVRAKLVQLAEYTGDRCYNIPNKVYTEAQNEIVQKNQPEASKNIETLQTSIKGYQSIYKECEARVKKVNALQAIIKENKKISANDLLNSMPEFVEHIMGLKDGCHSIRVDLKNKIGSYIKGYSDYNGSGGSEYGLYINTWYADQTRSQKVVYRDRYDHNKDDRSLNFDTLDIQNNEISPDNKKMTIHLVAKSKDRTKNYSFTFDVKEQDTTAYLTKEEQQKFLETFNATKQHILLEQKKRYEGNMMPVYCLPPEMTYNGMPGGDVPYKTPEIVQEAIDAKRGLAMIVIHKQIDHCAGHKRQMAREGYLIDKDGKYDRVAYEPLWDNERLGGKTISMDAKELLQKYPNK